LHKKDDFGLGQMHIGSFFVVESYQTLNKHFLVTMISVERLSPNTLSTSHFRRAASIGFWIHASSQPADSEVFIELDAVAPREATIRLLDQAGTILMERVESITPSQERMVFRVYNLSEGMYYVEVTDGFYHQVKEFQLRSSAS